MARNRYIKTYSNYTLKQIHQTTNIGTISERNFMTIADLNDYPMQGLPSYGLNGFKMIVDDGINLKKRHRYGSWLKNESCDRVSEYWSMSCMDEENDTLYGTSSDIVLKPDYSSFLDFAFYGSAVKLVESAIINIVKNFPGELFLRDDYVEVDGKRLYKVDNPFEIEFDSIYYTDEGMDNPLRVFSRSYDRYVITTQEGLSAPLSWERNIMNNDPCAGENSRISIIDLGSVFDANTHILLYYYIYDDKKTLFHDGTFKNASIKPNAKTVNTFFQNLNDFEKMLLNKKTNYTAYIETPQETERGNISFKKAYTWPKAAMGNWNIDVTTINYEMYVESLLEIAEFYDNRFTNNLISSMTHEPILNFDWTLKKVDENGFERDFVEEHHSQRIKSFVQIMGRNFDELKRYIDGIACVNKVSYDEVNNKPDYFLSDSLMDYGWDVRLPVPSKLSKFMTNPLYTGHVEGYTVPEANYEFCRRLLINSNAILSAKGTKRSIEMILALFGYRSLNFVEHSLHTIKRNGEFVNLKWGDLHEDEKQEILRFTYDMTEYVYVTDSGSTAYDKANMGDNTEAVKRINSLKAGYDFDNADELQGLPLREVITTAQEPIFGLGFNSEGILEEDAAIIGYKTVDKHYLIPWYDRDKEYDSDVYFESKGGWGLTLSKTNEILDYGNVYYETGDGLKVYDEGVKYLKFKENVNDLLNGVGEPPVVNEVYYVYDLSGAQNYDWGLLGDEVQPTMSHYFMLKDIEHDDVFGVLRDDEGNVLVENDGVYIDENGKIIDPQDIERYPNLVWEQYPTKKYGWKNISEEELKKGMTKDAQRVFYLEGIIETNDGNNPHVGYGEYDDGEEYKVFYEDVFKTVREDGDFDGVSDTELSYGEIKYDGKIFILNKEIDNVKCWYFTDFSEKQDVKQLIKVNEHTYNEIGNDIPIVGGDRFVRHYEDRGDEGINENEIGNPLFSSAQYSTIEPFNMEGGQADDEAAANSIINTKALYIEFVPDLKSPDSMYEFIDDIAMHYAKQVIPSTAIFKYKVPMTGWDVFCYHRTYLQSALITR